MTLDNCIALGITMFCGISFGANLYQTITRSYPTIKQTVITYSQNLFLSIAYNIIYIISYIQIEYTKYSKYVCKFFVFIKETLEENGWVRKKEVIHTTYVIFFKNGNMIDHETINSAFYSKIFVNCPLDIKNNYIEYDLIVIEKTESLNKEIYYSLDELNIHKSQVNVQEPFISLYFNLLDEINIYTENKTWEIKLKSKTFNYQLKGLIINKAFLRYYISYVLQQYIDPDIWENNKYLLECVTNDADIKIFKGRNNPQIRIEEDGFREI
jgi:hypothetical protein